MGQGGDTPCLVGSLQIQHALPRAWEMLEGEILDAAEGTPEFQAKQN
jgi:hypothetical protein